MTDNKSKIKEKVLDFEEKYRDNVILVERLNRKIKELEKEIDYFRNLCHSEQDRRKLRQEEIKQLKSQLKDQPKKIKELEKEIERLKHSDLVTAQKLIDEGIIELFDAKTGKKSIVMKGILKENQQLKSQLKEQKKEEHIHKFFLQKKVGKHFFYRCKCGQGIKTEWEIPNSKQKEALLQGKDSKKWLK